MRVVALNSDLLVFISRIWQTTCTAIRAQDECFVIDSLVYPDELQAVPGVLEQAGFSVSGLLTTHGDWDHLLSRTAFPAASLGCAASTAARLASEPASPEAELHEFDSEHYVSGRPRLSLDEVQGLPVPGRLALGSQHELELHAAIGHTADGAAYFIPWLAVLVCGDYLSPVEIPMISPGGSARRYLETLERLRRLVERATAVVPGHGEPMSAGDALTLLAEDAEYVRALELEGAQARLPEGRQTVTQQRIHAANAARLGATPPPS